MKKSKQHSASNRISTTLRKTRRHNITKYTTSNLVSTLLTFQIKLKLFHWNTDNYAQHKASDQLHTDLSENIDSFVEKLLGTTPKDRLREVKVCVKPSTETLTSIVTDVNKLKPYLIHMHFFPDTQSNSDLLNIRDEMLGQLNQFLYLIKLH